MKRVLLSLFNAFPPHLPSAPPSAVARVRPTGCVAGQVLSLVLAVNSNLSTMIIQES